jgi:hypothetical protein
VIDVEWRRQDLQVRSIELRFQGFKNARDSLSTGRYESSLRQLTRRVGAAFIENLNQCLIGRDHNICLQEIRGKLRVTR